MIYGPRILNDERVRFSYAREYSNNVVRSISVVYKSSFNFRLGITTLLENYFRSRVVLGDPTVFSLSIYPP